MSSELNPFAPTPLLCDNKGTVFTANNPVTNLRSRHLEVRWFKVRDYVRDGLLKVAHLRTEHNVADFFTKPLVGDHYKRFREFLMGKPVEQSYLLTLRTAFEHRPIIKNTKCIYHAPDEFSCPGAA